MDFASRFFAGLFVSTMLFPQGSVAQGAASGQVMLGYLDNTSLTTGYVFGDFTLSLHGETYGVDVGMFGVVGRLHETYAALTWTQGANALEFGFPRPAYDRFAPSALTQLMPRLALENIGASRSRATDGTMTEPDFLPYGAVYRLQNKTSQIAMSLHGVPDYDVTVFGAGGRMARGDWLLDVGVEAVAQYGDLDWNAKAQLRNERDWGTFGVGVFDANANDAGLTAEIFVLAQVGDDLSLRGVARYADDTDAQLGLGASYDIGRGISAAVAVVDGQSDAVSVDASVAFSF